MAAVRDLAAKRGGDLTEQERDAWRGVASEDIDEVPHDVSRRLRKRSGELILSLGDPVHLVFQNDAPGRP